MSAYQRVVREGGGKVAREGLAEMPLTLFLLVAGVVLFFYIRRAHLGIDLHPSEQTPAPVIRPTPTVKISPRAGVQVGPQGYPLLPPVGGLLSPGRN